MIDKTLEKYNLSEDKYYKLDTLYTIMKELGLIGMNRENFTNNWIRRKREKGLLILPEKTKSSYYLLHGRMIKDIIKAFVPGGSGKYVYEKSNL